ncbi:MAG: glyoxalase superfamily protein [Pseudomonadota bacterium]
MSIQLNSSIPVLRVSDYPRARAFYETLGFRMIEEGGEPAQFGIFRNGSAEVFLDGFHGADPQREAGWRMYCHLADVDAAAEQLRAAGIQLKRGPESMVYGCREIDIADPDGNCICFGQILDDA